MELIETFTFTRQIGTLLSDEEYREFQSQLAAAESGRSEWALVNVVSGVALA